MANKTVDWNSRIEKADSMRSRIKKLRIKYHTIAKNIGVATGHFNEIILGVRPIEPYEKTIELIVSEYELAEKRIKEKLYN